MVKHRDTIDYIIRVFGDAGCKKDRNFIQTPIELSCRECFRSIRNTPAGNIQPTPAVEGLVIVHTADYTGAHSPESERSSLIWKVGCKDQSGETGEGGESNEATK